MNINKKPFWALISLCKQDSKTSNVTVIGLQLSIWCHISASFLWRWMPKSYLLFSNHKLDISQRIIVIWPWGRHCKTHQIKGLRTIHVHIIVRFVDVFITLRNTHTRIYIYIYKGPCTMMTSSNRISFRVTGPLWGERPLARSFDLRLNKQLSKTSRRRWFVTPSRSFIVTPL